MAHAQWRYAKVLRRALNPILTSPIALPNMVKWRAFRLLTVRV